MPELTRSRFHLTFLRRINQHRVAITGECIRSANAEFKFTYRKWIFPEFFWLALLDEPGHKRLFAIKKREHSGIASGAPIERRQALTRRTPLDIHRISWRVAS